MLGIFLSWYKVVKDLPTFDNGAGLLIPSMYNWETGFDSKQIRVEYPLAGASSFRNPKPDL